MASGFDVDAATRAYLASIDPLARLRSDAYFEGGYWILLWGALVGIAINWALLHFGVAARVAGWAAEGRVTRRAATFVAVLVISLIAFIAELPWEIYTGFVREHQYGMSTQTLGGYLGEAATGLAIGLPLSAICVAVIFALVRRSPRRWWIGAAAFVLAALTLLVAVAPVAIEPLFNTYTKMPPSPLQAEIVRLARGSGVPTRDVLVVDASRQTKRVSANVSGLGPTARVALNDNLLATRDPGFIVAVTGHEVGHYVLGHVATRIAGFAVIVLGGFAAVQLGVPRLIAANPRWRVGGMGDAAAFPVWMIVFAVYALAVTPLNNTLVRFHEHQADVFGLNAARAPDGFARAALKLGEYRKLEPGPLEEAIFFDHPSGRTRIRMAMQWKAEHLGEPGVR